MSSSGSKREKSSKVRQPAIIFICIALVMASLAALWFAGIPKGESAMKEFAQSTGLAEDPLIDPLILAGNDIVPLVLRDIGEKDMPRRRYAIGFLGNGGFQEALPALLQIIGDSQETDVMRGDALESVAMIDRPKGLDLAQQYQNADGHLKYVANELLKSPEMVFHRRTYWQAFFHEHE